MPKIVSITEIIQMSAIASTLKTIQMNLDEIQKMLSRGEIRPENVIPLISEALGKAGDQCIADVEKAYEELNKAKENLELASEEAMKKTYKS